MHDLPPSKPGVESAIEHKTKPGIRGRFNQRVALFDRSNNFPPLKLSLFGELNPSQKNAYVIEEG